jgi:hypothetical protein
MSKASYLSVRLAVAVVLAGSTNGWCQTIIGYEMTVPPNYETVPMTKVGGGFGDPATDDFADMHAFDGGRAPNGPAGVYQGSRSLDGAGVARFIDGGTEATRAAAGFYKAGLGNAFTVDMLVKANWSNVTGTFGSAGGARMMGITNGNPESAGAGPGAEIRLNSNANRGIQFAGVKSGAEVKTAWVNTTPTLASWHTIRISINDKTITVYDLDNDQDTGPGVNYPVVTSWDMGVAGINKAGLVSSLMGPSAGGAFQLNSMETVPGCTSWGDISVDWVRIGTPGALGSTDPVIPRLPRPACLSVVVPDDGNQAAHAITGQAATPSQIVYTVINGGANTVHYSIAEVDDQGQPLDYGWLSLDKSSVALDSELSEPVTAAIDTAGLIPGVYTAYVRFTDDCNPVTVITRTIVLTVETCPWAVTPLQLTGPGQDWAVRARTCPTGLTYPFTVRNTGTSAISFTVQESNAAGDAGNDWPEIQIDAAHWDSGNNQPIPVTLQPSASDTVTITTTASAGNITGFKNVHLLFDSGCTPPDKQVRTIRIDEMTLTTPPMFRYDGAVEPDAPNSFGTGFTFQLAETFVKQGSAVDDLFAFDYRAYKLVDTSLAKERWLQSPALGADGILAHRGATIVARVKVEAAVDDQGGNILTFDDGGLTAGYHFGGPTAGRIAEARRDLFNLEDVNRANSNYHIIRMTVIGGDDTGYGRTITFYFDENAAPVAQQTSASPLVISGIVGDYFGFGADHAGSSQTISFDWITATASGAFAPGQEQACLGESLVPNACKDPFADADGDTDVDQVDFAFFQHCVTGPTDPITDFGPPVNCTCFDRNHDGHVSFADYAPFEFCASGPGIPANPACDG